jgi:hypothetical protein
MPIRREKNAVAQTSRRCENIVLQLRTKRHAHVRITLEKKFAARRKMTAKNAAIRFPTKNITRIITSDSC